MHVKCTLVGYNVKCRPKTADVFLLFVCLLKIS